MNTQHLRKPYGKTIRALLMGLGLGACFSTAPAMAAAKLMPTPFGEFPPECVRQHPHGTKIEEVKKGLKATYQDGTSRLIPRNPKCAAFVNKAKSRSTAQASASSAAQSLPIKWEWFNFASWTAPSQITSYTANYTVPTTPTNVSGQVLFYFIGIQNDATIVQPVLGFENQQWNISSWNCCIGGAVNYSPFIYGMKPGDTIGGSITADSQGAFTITTTWNNQPTTLVTTPVGSPFTWANATLEVYYIDTCNEFSSGPMTFTNLQMASSSGPLSPNWSFSPANKQTICNGRIAQNGNTMTIQENIYVDINAGPIWDNQDAQGKCPPVCAGAGLNWSGQWQTTQPGVMSVCGCN